MTISSIDPPASAGGIFAQQMASSLHEQALTFGAAPEGALSAPPRPVMPGEVTA